MDVVEACHGLENVLETDGIGMEHRPTEVARKPVAVDPNHIDVERALDKPLVDNLGALID